MHKGSARWFWVLEQGKTHHELEKLFTESLFLNMVLTSSTILGHEVLEGQHHAVQEFADTL
jgi:hypothetical protein